jgi:hypothetical protein
MRVEADRAEHVMDPLLTLLRILDAGYHQRFSDDVADPPPRVQRGDRVLENQLHAPAHPPQGVALHRREVLAVEQHLARHRFAQLQHRAPERRFSAAGFSDQTERLATRDLEADVRHRMDRLVADGIFDHEIFHPEQGIAGDRLRDGLHHAGTAAVMLIGRKQAYW